MIYSKFSTCKTFLFLVILLFSGSSTFLIGQNTMTYEQAKEQIKNFQFSWGKRFQQHNYNPEIERFVKDKVNKNPKYLSKNKQGVAQNYGNRIFFGLTEKTNVYTAIFFPLDENGDPYIVDNPMYFNFSDPCPELCDNEIYADVGGGNGWFVNFLLPLLGGIILGILGLIFSQYLMRARN